MTTFWPDESAERALAVFTADGNDDPPPPAARASRQAQYLLAVASRLRAEQNHALSRTRTLDSQQLVTRVRLDAYQELARLPA
jgi:hypothetical protein